MKKYMNKTIGILGGMGPMASSNLYKKIIEHAQQKYGAVQDFDYPPVLLYSLPMFGFNETGITDKKLVKEQLIYGVKTLEKAGSDFIIIACNTVHCFYNQMQKTVQIPILNMIELTAQRVAKDGYKVVGLLSSENTVALGLYQKALKKHCIEAICVNDNQQKIINNIIEHVMGGTKSEDDTAKLKKIIVDLESQGAQAIVLGCTEIPLAINQTDTKVKLFNTIEIIAEVAVKKSLIK